MQNITKLCICLVAAVSIALIGSPAFAERPSVPTQTYSWSVYIPINSSSNLQGVGFGNNTVYLSLPDSIVPSIAYPQGNFTRNFVNVASQRNATWTIFNYEFFVPFQIKLSSVNPDSQSCTGNDCEHMFAQITQAQPNGEYARVFFGFQSATGYIYDEQPFNCEQPIKAYFYLDSALTGDPLAFKNTIRGYIGEFGDVAVTRIDENVWHIYSKSPQTTALEQRELTTVTQCNGKKCQEISVSAVVATGNASPINFELYFVRTPNPTN